MKGELKFKIYHSGILRPSWKWKAVAPNGEIIASGRGFKSAHGANTSIHTLFDYIKSSKFVIEIKQRKG